MAIDNSINRSNGSSDVTPDNALPSALPTRDPRGQTRRAASESGLLARQSGSENLAPRSSSPGKLNQEKLALWEPQSDHGSEASLQNWLQDTLRTTQEHPPGRLKPAQTAPFGAMMPKLGGARPQKTPLMKRAQDLQSDGTTSSEHRDIDSQSETSSQGLPWPFSQTSDTASLRSESEFESQHEYGYAESETPSSEVSYKSTEEDEFHDAISLPLELDQALEAAAFDAHADAQSLNGSSAPGRTRRSDNAQIDVKIDANGDGKTDFGIHISQPPNVLEVPEHELDAYMGFVPPERPEKPSAPPAPEHFEFSHAQAAPAPHATANAGASPLAESAQSATDAEKLAQKHQGEMDKINEMSSQMQYHTAIQKFIQSMTEMLSKQLVSLGKTLVSLV